MITLAQRANLTVLYNEPHRYYHTLNHIQHCLRELDETCLGLSQEERVTIEAAIWFHDAVYDPKAQKGRNEGASIDLMHNSNLSGVPLTTVEDLIAATINHEIPIDEPWASAVLLENFLDIDLAILGQSEDDYDLYCKQIRSEYSWVPEKAYQAGRRQVLVGFLARQNIYFTSHFREKYEAQARLNLSREAITLIPNHHIKIHDPK